MQGCKAVGTQACPSVTRPTPDTVLGSGALSQITWVGYKTIGTHSLQGRVAPGKGQDAWEAVGNGCHQARNSSCAQQWG